MMPRLRDGVLVPIKGDDRGREHAFEFSYLFQEFPRVGAEGLLLLDEFALFLDLTVLLLDTRVRIVQLDEQVDECAGRAGQRDRQEE